MMLNLIKETMIDLNGPLSRSIAQIFQKRYVGAVGSVCAVQVSVDNENLQIYQIDDAEKQTHEWRKKNGGAGEVVNLASGTRRRRPHGRNKVWETSSSYNCRGIIVGIVSSLD
jgi:hypothetical protein